jgi:hypothetical protein
MLEIWKGRTLLAPLLTKNLLELAHRPNSENTAGTVTTLKKIQSGAQHCVLHRTRIPYKLQTTTAIRLRLLLAFSQLILSILHSYDNWKPKSGDFI